MYALWDGEGLAAPWAGSVCVLVELPIGEVRE